MAERRGDAGSAAAMNVTTNIQIQRGKERLTSSSVGGEEKKKRLDQTEGRRDVHRRRIFYKIIFKIIFIVFLKFILFYTK